MSNRIVNEDSERKPTILGWLGSLIRKEVASLRMRIRTWNVRRKRIAELRRQFREEQRLDRKESARSWRLRARDRLYQLFDYDPTDALSGEVREDSLASVVFQWWLRMIWVRRIEVGGLILVCCTGYLCYSAVMNSAKTHSASATTPTIEVTDIQY